MARYTRGCVMLGPGPSSVRSGGFSSGERPSSKRYSSRRVPLGRHATPTVRSATGSRNGRGVALAPVPTSPHTIDMEPEQRFYLSQRLRLSYCVWGDERKPPVLLVHGGRDHARNWDYLAAALVPEWSVY